MDTKKIVIDLSSKDKFVDSVRIKKKDLTDTTPMEYLYYLCQNAKNGNYNKERMMKIISQRILALEDAGRIFIEEDEDQMFEHVVDEIDLLKEVLKQ